MKLARPLVALAVGSSLVLGGTAFAAAPKLPKCTSFTDAKGDTALEGLVPVSDSSLDITGVKLAYRKKVLKASVTVAKYAAASTYSDGVRFDVNFTAPNGKVVTLFGQHSRTEAVMTNVFVFQGIKIDDTYISGTVNAVEVSTSGNTFTMTVRLSDLEAALEGKLAGKAVTALNAIAWGGYEAFSLPYDEAAGSKPMKFVDCA